MKQHKNSFKKWMKTGLEVVSKNPLWFTALCGGFLGFVVFAIIYGFGLVDPTNVEWLKMDFNDPLKLSFDLKQHYLGWVWYRASSWSWPLGIISSQAYPTGISITYLDSIPLLAIIFKLFSWCLPNNFQYLGLWQLICFVLQSAFAAVIIRKFTKNLLVILPGAILFILSPIFLTRVFFHAALASQWLILAGIALLIYRERLNLHQTIFAWATILSLGVLIHPYFAPMLLALMFVDSILSHKNWRDTILKITAPTAAMVLVFGAIGGFMPTNLNTDGIGYHSLDLAYLFIPEGWSLVGLTGLIVPEQTVYLGLGVIYAFFICMILFTYKILFQKFFSDNFKLWLKKHLGVRYLLVCGVLLLLLAISIGSTIYFLGQPIFSIKLPSMIQNFWGVFRSSSRLAWPIYYLLITTIIFGLIHLLQKSPKIMVVVFLFLALIQVSDIGLSPNLIQKMKDVRTIQTEKHKPSLDISRWLVFARGKKHLVFIDEKMLIPDSYALSDVAMAANLTMNQAYYARSPEVAIKKTKAQAASQLKSGKLDQATIYVTRKVYWTAFSTKILHDGDFYAIVAD